jgi:hypothetical protein
MGRRQRSAHGGKALKVSRPAAAATTKAKDSTPTTFAKSCTQNPVFLTPPVEDLTGLEIA